MDNYPAEEGAMLVQQKTPTAYAQWFAPVPRIWIKRLCRSEMVKYRVRDMHRPRAHCRGTDCKYGSTLFK